MSIKSKFVAIKNKIQETIISMSIMVSPAIAASGGFDKANESINAWVIGLGTLAVATVTLCVMWIGYKVLWDGKKLSDMQNVIIGGILITGASGFGAYYMS